MEIKKSIKTRVGYFGIILSTAILTVWLFLMALNGRYIYANMEGDDLIIDKWTRRIYVFTGEPELTDMRIVISAKKVEEIRKKYNIPILPFESNN